MARHHPGLGGEFAPAFEPRVRTRAVGRQEADAGCLGDGLAVCTRALRVGAGDAREDLARQHEAGGQFHQLGDLVAGQPRGHLHEDRATLAEAQFAVERTGRDAHGLDDTRGVRRQFVARGLIQRGGREVSEFQEPGLGAEQLPGHRDDDHFSVAHISVGAVLRTGHVLFEDRVAGERAVEFEPFFGVHRGQCRARLLDAVDARDVHAAAGIDGLDDRGEPDVRTGLFEVRRVAHDHESRHFQASLGHRLAHFPLVPDLIDGCGGQGRQSETRRQLRGTGYVVFTSGHHGMNRVSLMGFHDSGLEGGVVIGVHRDYLGGKRAHRVGDYATPFLIGGHDDIPADGTGVRDIGVRRERRLHH